ncbi:MAG: WecB/TagA/CpsF family glycosyltransferase [Parcubacteria group bacterium]|nr:WecB/TagA/CpsF family glycosyltransferase [Parcubacteria group bacterium]
MHILGVRIDPVRRAAMPAVLLGLLTRGAQHVIATPNPEMLVHAHHDPSFRALLNRADLNVPDGVGLVLISRFLGNALPERVTGADLVGELAALAAHTGASLYLFGDRPGIAENAAQALRLQFPALRIHTDSGGPVRRERDGYWSEGAEIVSRIQAVRPAILIVALGHGKQEQWIFDHLPLLPSVKIAIGVGGALHYYAGSVRRAPRLLRRVGLEWFWRLITEPWRWRRIFTALIIFPILALHHRKTITV